MTLRELFLSFVFPDSDECASCLGLILYTMVPSILQARTHHVALLIGWLS